jgi:broad specificity phosphatase PhoE
MVVILVRHAERQAGDDPHLDADGKRRANLLAAMLGESGVAAIFTSTYKRTKETAAPLAELLGLTPKVIADDPIAAAAEVRAAGSCVLVVGHTDTVPELIERLGGPDVAIDDDEFDRMFILSTAAADPTQLLAMRYGPA